jgi:hypothetical protein
MSRSEEKLAEDKDLNRFIRQLYDVQKITDADLKLWNESYSYKGFDRLRIINELRKKVPDVRTCQQIIIICGLNGPKRASKTLLLSGKTVESYGIPSSGVKGSSSISCQRITASTADLCAFFLKKINIPKRMMSELPGWLQFPSAGSIALPDNLRVLHMEFTKKFSILIGGSFNEQIYNQMQHNCYLDVSLSLFDS